MYEMTDGHTVKAFNEELESINALVVELGGWDWISCTGPYRHSRMRMPKRRAW
ncbi:MAG: hypothetical protein ABW161_03155 [Candidatus Thiodiazotropha sp.]